MRRIVIPVVMVVVVALLVWAGVHNLRSRRVAMQQAQQAQVTVQKDSDAMPDGALTVELKGKPAPGFTLLDLSGKKVSLADYKGKPVVVNFWATYCGPCQLEMPWFQEFTKKYADKDLVVLGIDEEDGVTKEAVAKAAGKLGVTYPILFAEGKVGSNYGVGDYLPVTVYVGKDGTVVAQTPGAPSKDEMEANIRKAIGL